MLSLAHHNNNTTTSKSQMHSVAGDEMSDREKLRKEIVSLSDFEKKMILLLIVDGRTLRDALRIIKNYSEVPKVGPSEFKEA